MNNQISELENESISEINTCNTEDSIAAARIKFLGKKGKLTLALKELGALSIEEKKTFGPKLHQLKQKITIQLETKKQELEKEALNVLLEKERIDNTLPSEKIKRGKIHILNQTINEVTNIFGQIGFTVAQGPEIESDFYNFGALNFPPDHPARDMHDTFYVESKGNLLLRTHTSNVQIHVMENYKPPIRVIMPGKVFRSDTDVSHSPVFHQVEGLYVDKNVSFGNLKAILQYFFDSFFQKGNKIRLRPSYFPFTEPSVEVDVACVICNGDGCGVCKQTGWLEILGAGMVDPNVLKNVNLDPDKYSGLAFGVGIERLAMLKYGINNIKLYYDNHKYFLEQF